MTAERWESSNVTGFENGGRGPLTKECEWPLEAVTVKETDSPLEPPGRNAGDVNPKWLVSDF